MALTWQIYGYGLACCAFGALSASMAGLKTFGKWLQVLFFVVGVVLMVANP